MFQFSAISWLGLQQETVLVNVNFERRGLTSAQKSHPSLDNFGETYAFKLIKRIFLFTFFFNTKPFAVPLQDLNLNY